MPPPQIGVPTVIVVVVVEPVLTVLVTVNVVCAGHVSDFEYGELGNGVQADVVSLAPQVAGNVLPPPPLPRSRFLAPATKRPNNVTKSKNFIFRSAALAERHTEGRKRQKKRQRR